MTIVIYPERCTGCRLCEIVCSVEKEGLSWPYRSRIRVYSLDEEEVYLPALCHHCENPLCATVCPVNAIERDEAGQILYGSEVCVKCSSCVTVCPIGGLRFDAQRKIILRCDLCGGDPLCVKYCEAKAIQYVDPEDWQMIRKREIAGKLYSGVRLSIQHR